MSTRSSITIDTASMDRLPEIVGYAAYYGRTIPEAINELVNEGLSHNDWPED